MGLSSRTNEAGIEQLRLFLEPFDYEVKAVKVDGCLHLKTAATLVGPNVLLANPDWADLGVFAGMEVLQVAPSEPMAGNAMLVGETVVYPMAHVETRKRLEARGLDVVAVDQSEFAKAEGGVTCLSLLFSA